MQNEWPLAGKSPSYWKSLSPTQLKQDPDWKPLDKAIKSSDKEYKIGKMVCHASSYRMRERTFQLQTLKQSHGTLTLSLQECKTFLGFFASLFPEIIEWQDEKLALPLTSQSLWRHAPIACSRSIFLPLRFLRCSLRHLHGHLSAVFGNINANLGTLNKLLLLKFVFSSGCACTNLHSCNFFLSCNT